MSLKIVTWSACRVGLRHVVEQIVSNQDERVQQDRISNTYHYQSESTGIGTIRSSAGDQHGCSSHEQRLMINAARDSITNNITRHRTV